MEHIKDIFICQNCKQEIDTPDFGDGTYDCSDVYEYRGFYFHEKCFDDCCKKVDYRRQEVMEVTEASIKSQRTGEFINNSRKYNLSNVASDGLPNIKSKESQILKDYENSIL